MIKTIELKNGTTEAEGLVSVTMMSLSHLIQENAMGFYELVMKCRDRDHQFWGDIAKDLKNLGLVESDGRVHGSIRNIVLSAVIGEGMGMTLGSPLGDES